MNMGSSVVHQKVDPTETTEWEDILRKKGVIGPSQAEIEREAAEAARQLAEEAKERIDPLEHKTLDELDELEEGGEYDDSRALDEYRARRLAEIKAATARNKFGRVFPLSRQDFVPEVNDASKEAWVVVFLHQEHVNESRMLLPVVHAFAGRHKDVKIMQIRADACIENYPDRNVPTLLLYHEGSLQGQIVGLAELGGLKVTIDVLEWVLYKRGVCKTEQLDDPRERLGRGGAGAGGGGLFAGRRGAAALSDDEED